MNSRPAVFHTITLRMARQQLTSLDLHKYCCDDFAVSTFAHASGDEQVMFDFILSGVALFNCMPSCKTLSKIILFAFATFVMYV